MINGRCLIGDEAVDRQSADVAAASVPDTFLVKTVKSLFWGLDPSKLASGRVERRAHFRATCVPRGDPLPVTLVYLQALPQ